MAFNSGKKLTQQDLTRLLNDAINGDLQAQRRFEELRTELGISIQPSDLMDFDPDDPDFWYDDDDDDDDDDDFPSALSDNDNAWRESLRAVHSFAPPSLHKRAAKLDPEALSIKSATPDGTVTAEYAVGNKVHRITMRLKFAERLTVSGCSCFRSSNVSPCEHQVLLASVMLKEIDDAGGVSQWLPQDKDAIANETLDVIDRFLAANQSTPAEPAMAITLPSSERMAWRIVVEDDLYLEAVLQKRRKNGDWSAGRLVPVEQIIRGMHNHLLSARDRRFVEEVEALDDSYYSYFGRRLSFGEFVPALGLLVGHNAVFFENRALTIEPWTPMVRVAELPDGHYRVGIQFAEGIRDTEEVRVLFNEDDGVALMPSEPRLVFGTLRPGEFPLVRQLLAKHITISPERLPDLQRRLESLGRVLSVRLPESLGGQESPTAVRPVLLAHARQSGELDLALRVLDPHDRVARPGEGVLRTVVDNGGERLQLWRDPHQETDTLQAIARRLFLTGNVTDTSWNYRLTDFGEILEVLDLAEAMAARDELRIVWDERSVQKMTLMGSVSPRNVRVEVSRQRDWFGLNGTFTLGDREIPLVDMLAALDGQRNGRYLEIEPGKWAEISDQFRSRLLTLRDTVHLNRKKLQFDATAAEAVRELVGEDIELKATRAWADCIKRIAHAKEFDPEPPIAFNGQLRDYQRDGYRWLSRLAAWGVGGCLADDMGLGKTVQMLAVLVDRMEVGPALVIAPTSVGFNWQKETERFAPTLTPALYRETERAGFLEEVDNGHVVICSYGLALRDAESLAKVRWGTLVLDEAQFIKNSRSKTAKAIRTLDADWKVALTGTPMENHLGELWSLFHAVSPGLFGAWEQFRKRFATPIEKQNDNERRQALSRVMKPFLLRRSKAEVLSELPERTEVNLYVDLSADERKRYDEMRLAAVAELDDIAGAPDTDDQRFKILALLTRLRQLSCHIGLVDDKWTDTSSKLDLLIETLTELKDEGHRALVFSQFTSHLDLIRSACRDNSISFQYLDGKTTAKQRQQRIEAFQSGEGDVFLISLKAGGTGLNLTAADYVIHTDPWWNPAVEDQATDRAHRIGQTRPVMVYRIISRNTIEEQILSLHAEKRDLVNSLLEGTESAGRFSTEELSKLIREGAVESRS